MIIVYGGSFDPPHLGHLHTSRAVQRTFSASRFLWVPCKTPVLKSATRATVEQRLSMLALTLRQVPEFEIDAREMQRTTPSFMIETLCSIRDEVGPDISIGLLMGMDAFLQLPAWHDWKNLLTVGHIIVMKRPAVTPLFNSIIEAWLPAHLANNKGDLLNAACGRVYFLNAGNYSISSTALRALIKAGQDIHAFVAPGVAEYITDQALYQ